MEFVKLNNGIMIPKIGYGVYQIPKEITKECVLNALSVGYRHIDTAFMYHNEKEVGEAIKESGIARSEIFVTTKIVNAKDYDEACQMIECALKTLNLDYIDLMLIHWPAGDNLAMYKAMEDYYFQGKLKAIGLSNFYGNELDNIIKHSRVIPTIDQIEAHVFNCQIETQKELEKHSIVLEAWSPLAAAKLDIFSNPTLVEIANKYHKSVAQIALRYLYQRNIVIIPRSKNVERMKENIDILDFSLDVNDIKEIEKLDRKKSIYQ